MELMTNTVHPSWQPLVNDALTKVDGEYRKKLAQSQGWLPGVDKIFNAFCQPLADTRYILFGESPYPRPASAIGHAFWDGAVGELWSEQGLCKPVNRATSLRNIIKMLLVARGDLQKQNTSQPAIAALNKANYVTTIDQLFTNFLDRGFLLLNASLVLTEQSVPKDVKAWRPFMDDLLTRLHGSNPHVQLILLGRLAETIDALPSAQGFARFYAEHPYNVSFITNDDVLDFFRPMDLLAKCL